MKIVLKRNIVGAVVACQIACMSFGALELGTDVLENPYICTPSIPGVSKMTPEAIRDENFPTVARAKEGGVFYMPTYINARAFTHATAAFSRLGQVLVSLFNGLTAQAIYHYAMQGNNVAAVIFANATRFGGGQYPKAETVQEESTSRCFDLKRWYWSPLGIAGREDLGKSFENQLCYAPVSAVLRNPAFVTPAEGFCLQGLPLIYLPYQFRQHVADKEGREMWKISFDHYRALAADTRPVCLIFSAAPSLSASKDFDGTAFHSVNVKKGNISNELVAALRAYASSWDKFNCGRPDKDCNCTGRNLPENAEAFRNFMQMLMFGNLESLRAKIEETELSLKGLMARGMSLDESIVDPLRMVGRDRFLKPGAEHRAIDPNIAVFAAQLLVPLFDGIKLLIQKEIATARIAYFNRLCIILGNQVRLAVASGCNTLIIGRFGCGVFGNRDEDVASAYGWAIETYGQDIKNVVIADNMDYVQDGEIKTNPGRLESFRAKMLNWRDCMYFDSSTSVVGAN